MQRASCGCCPTATAWSSCSKESAPLPVPFFGFSFASFVLASSGGGLFLWIRPTFRAQVAFLTAAPTNNVLAKIRILTLVSTFASFLAVLAKAVHIHWIWSVLCSNRLVCELTSTGSNAGLSFASNLLVRGQSCTVHRNILVQLTWTEGYKRSGLDVFNKSSCRPSARSTSHFSSPAGRSCSSHRSGTRICRRSALFFFFYTSDQNDGPNVKVRGDLMELLQD